MLFVDRLTAARHVLLPAELMGDEQEVVGEAGALNVRRNRVREAIVFDQSQCANVALSPTREGKGAQHKE